MACCRYRRGSEPPDIGTEREYRGTNVRPRTNYGQSTQTISSKDGEVVADLLRPREHKREPRKRTAIAGEDVISRNALRCSLCMMETNKGSRRH